MPPAAAPRVALASILPASLLAFGSRRAPSVAPSRTRAAAAVPVVAPPRATDAAHARAASRRDASASPESPAASAAAADARRAAVANASLSGSSTETPHASR